MADVKVYDMSGNEVSTLALNDEIFGVEPNEAIIHALVVNYLANRRQGTQSTLTRTEVRGGGKKPWRQKGTGHARQGSTRSPQWKHGGVALGPKPRSYRHSLNKKARRSGMKSALSAKVAAGDMLVIDGLKMDEFSTKTIVKTLAPHLAYEKSVTIKKGEKAGLETVRSFWNKALVVLDTNDEKIIKSAANIPGVKTTQVNTLCVYDIVNYDKLIVLKDALGKIEEVYA
ncbi:MAG: 50S ribosomal protein L4 [Oscillospiraceae bacterium]|jgi:large subunit ribosomal protein L4|nr:50S ribosomal protein L4 [Oscillospiraceae bacterium]